METFEVKCSVCGKVFERQAVAQPVAVPAELHDQPDHPGVPCLGTGQATVAVGQR